MMGVYYSCGWYGEIYKSIDSGATWTQVPTGLSSTITLSGVYFTHPDTGWVVGANGTILKTVTAGIGIIEPEILNNFIYPNPASNYFMTETPSPVEHCKLISAYGLEFSPTWNNNRFDVSHLPSGVYLVRLKLINGKTLESKLIIY